MSRQLVWSVNYMMTPDSFAIASALGVSATVLAGAAAGRVAMTVIPGGGVGDSHITDRMTGFAVHSTPWRVLLTR